MSTLYGGDGEDVLHKLFAFSRLRRISTIYDCENRMLAAPLVQRTTAERS